MIRLLVLISGGGSGLQAVIDACGKGRLDAEIVAVVSSNHQAGGITRAKNAGIPTYVCSLPECGGSKEARDKQILQIAAKSQADYIVMLGYLGICTSVLISAYPKKIINIHPALLPKYGGAGFFGLNVHRAVIQAGETISGATVHYADEGTDTGEIIMQKTVEVLRDDTPESLQKRVLQAEHILIIDALNKVIKEN